MSGYKCIKCGIVLDTIPEGIIRCPNCSFRVLEKLRPDIVKEVIAR
jgi:DNA-directed RNA polymerase subunit RPC12/RpoP